MTLSRRSFLTLAAGGLASSIVFPVSLLRAAEQSKIMAIAFDAFVIFDPRPVFALVKELFPDKGQELGQLWLTKQFSYTWLRTSAGKYEDFWHVTEDALVYAAESLELELTPEKRERLMQAYLNLKAWPDVKPALEKFRENKIRLTFLANLTEHMLRANIKNAGIEGSFDFILSTDRVQVFKPDPKAYQMGVEALGLSKEEIAYAAFAGWDAAGASWFGFPTIWVNRLGMPSEKLGIAPIAITSDIGGLEKFVLS
ncbi:MAG: haloacid dehalogenase type II [Syntrophobacteraceae bacterium]